MTADQHPIISATAIDGLHIETSQGKPAALAVIDGGSNILESGPELADAVFDLIVECYRRFMIGEAAIRVLLAPPNTSQKESDGTNDIPVVAD